MLGQFLDDRDPEDVRRYLTTVTLSRLGANACYRYSAPFLATIADGLDVSLSRIGVAITITEAVGLSAPLLASRIDRRHHPTTMVFGLAGITVGALIAAIGPGLVWFVAGLVVLAIAKIVFDLALGAWAAAHVPYERRGRVVGLIETSWALGMLVGVSVMGVVTALTSWRWGYVTGAVMTTAAIGAITVRLGGDRRTATPGTDPTNGSPDRGRGQRATLPTTAGLRAIGHRGAWMVAAMLSLSTAAQTLFFTFGAWLEDDHDFTAASLAAVTFGIGGLELVASTTSAARVDRWGKERSVILGTCVMIPTAGLLALFNGVLALGVIVLCVFIAAFEFSIVSSISISGDLIPGSPARGLSAVIAAATVGRALSATPATWLYERNGIWAPAIGAAALATLTMACVVQVQRLAVIQSTATGVTR